MRHFLCALWVLGFFTTAAKAIPTVIGFDDRPGQSPPFDEGIPVQAGFLISTQYSSLGVVFNSGGGGIAVAAPGNPVSPPNTVNATAPGPVFTIAPGAFVDATFTVNGSPAIVDTVSLTLSNSSSLSQLQAFDLNGVSLGSSSGGAATTLTANAPGLIYSVRLTGGPFAFDNFTFNGLAPVPEPINLTIAGVVGLGLMRVRGRQQIH